MLCNYNKKTKYYLIINIIFCEIFNLKGLFFSKRTFFFSISFFLLFPLFFSQQAIQIENIHIDKGATIIEKKSNEEITYTSYDDNSKKLIIEVLNLSDKKSFAKKGNHILAKKKNIKKEYKKTFNNKKEASTNFVYDKSSNSHNSLSSSYENYKQITNSNNYTSKFISNHKNWVLALYFIEQEQSVLYKSYNSKNIITRFFTRPPPYNRFV